MTRALRIVADRNVTGIAEAVRTLVPQQGQPGPPGPQELPGRASQPSQISSTDLALVSSAEITADLVRDADLLFVRSTVRCGPALLSGSSVRFVATATIGTDHLDLPWLAAQGITVASAPGCNADSVVQWLAAALLHARQRIATPLAVAGVVGLGNVGSRVARLLAALGCEVLRCDPPRQRAGGDPWPYHDLDTLCASSDLLTLHVPLTRQEAGEDRTWGLIDERRLLLMPRHAVLINAARGEVIDEAALSAALSAGRLAAALLDVFPGEPSPSPELVGAALLATPHIAGHSLEGKVNGTRQVYQAACAFLGVTPTWQPGPALLPANPLDGAQLYSDHFENRGRRPHPAASRPASPEGVGPRTPANAGRRGAARRAGGGDHPGSRTGSSLSAAPFIDGNPLAAPGPAVLAPNDHAQHILHDLLRRSYDITVDDAALRRIVALPAAERGAAFRRYRESYPIRRQLTGAHLHLPPGNDNTGDSDPALSTRLRPVLAALGADLD